MKFRLKGKRFYILAFLILSIFTLYYFESGLDQRFYLTMLLFVSAASIIYLGYIGIDTLFNRWISWKKRPVGRLILELLSLLVFSLLVLNFLFFTIRDSFTLSDPTQGQIVVFNGYSILFLLPILTISYSIKILRNWQKSVLESERIQKENMHTELMSLRNHLDPHFLFNNLNVLSSLIDIDHELSQKYLENFALVYRNILQKRNDELIPLTEELDLIHNYIFLLDIRFGKGVSFNINIDEKHKNYFIPPLTFQLLVENCIKHNTTDKTNPLVIEIYSLNDESITIKNNLQQRFDTSSSNKSGLENIKSRFRFYTDKTPTIEKTNDYFLVNIPLINVENI